jgi:23S rRNA pseudouridine1911/1915/1917 synthase
MSVSWDDPLTVNGGFEYREEVGKEAAGRTVLAWLARRYRHSTEAAWRERIATGEVRLDGRGALAMDVLRPGQSLVWRRPPWEEPAVPLGFAILYRDDHLLAVAKPRGLPSVPNGGFLEHTLLSRVRRLYPEAVPMHRLGRGTSGLVLFARTDGARRAVAAEWRRGGVEKEYLALVSGRPALEELTIDAPIGLVKHPRLGQVHAASPAGKPAVSHVRVLALRESSALVAVTIPTGRPHQIRIHLAAAGHPLVGDPLYVEGGVPGPDPGLPGEGGYRLHAHRLALTHPATGRRLELECPPPLELLG